MEHIPGSIALIEHSVKKIIEHTLTWCFVTVSCFVVVIVPLAVASLLLMLRWIS